MPLSKNIRKSLINRLATWYTEGAHELRYWELRKYIKNIHIKGLKGLNDYSDRSLLTEFEEAFCIDDEPSEADAYLVRIAKKQLKRRRKK